MISDFGSSKVLRRTPSDGIQERTDTIYTIFDF
jgi:hypothetical protein